MIFQRVNSYKYYQDSVDMLRNVFKRLELIMDGEPVIYLADPAFRKFAVLLWDEDKDGYITPKEAKVPRYAKFEMATTDIEIVDFRNIAIAGSYNSGKTYTPNVREVYCGSCSNGNAIPFEACEKLELVDIGPHVTILPHNSYRDNHNLKKVVLNDVLEIINGYTFTNCVSLEEISEIPDSCTMIYNKYNQQSFRNCTSLKSITIGRGMQRIGWATFMDCTAMETFYIKATTPPILDTDVFKNNFCTIYVPIGSGAAYKTATNWSVWASRIQEYNF